MVEMATSERAHQVATNNKTRDRLVNKNQFRDKLFKYLSDAHGECRHKRTLIKHVGEYYQDQGKSPPFNKLADIVLWWCGNCYVRSLIGDPFCCCELNNILDFELPFLDYFKASSVEAGEAFVRRTNVLGVP